MISPYIPESFVKTDGVRLCTDAFGGPHDPAVLLIMGASASMVWWDDEFCARLASRGRFVVRFDNRDVGRSTTCPPGQPCYSVETMADDAIRVLRHYHRDAAHVVGMSLGGMIGQILALKYPKAVRTLTLISSSVWDKRPDLPTPGKKFLEYHGQGGTVDWTNKETAVNFMVGGWRLLNGSRHPFDEKQALRLATTEFDRAANLPSMFNHAFLKGGEQLFGKAKQINVPALIIHGTKDPVLPYEHALALAEELPDATLIKLDGRGHEIHHLDWDTIVEAVYQITQP